MTNHFWNWTNLTIIVFILLQFVFRFRPASVSAEEMFWFDLVLAPTSAFVVILIRDLIKKF
jgi:hypothetical protein